MSEEKEEDTKKFILAMIMLVYQMEAMQANMHSNFPAKVTHDFKI